MNESEFDQVGPYLEKTFAEIRDFSVAISGSMSRGDFRVAEGGEILSDLDLIPVIRRREDAAAARRRLAPLLEDVANRFGITCTAAITLSDNFLRVRHAAFVTSMADRSFVCDPLGLRLQLDRASDRTTRDILPWRVQPVTYYLAKAGHTKPLENVTKAVRAFELLIQSLTFFGHGPNDSQSERWEAGFPFGSQDAGSTGLACAEALRRLVARHDISLLPSSREFLTRSASDGTGESTFHAVRAHTFLENQGLPFEESSIMARPTMFAERG
ncbi:hypothetical protein [Streptomyces yangpuensis]|uniref:hypothetical protein n=1 Tax=Streptomyces yangpuensis TaxID=1648182 RepID=UPI0038066FE8